METAQPLPTPIPPVLKGGPFDIPQNPDVGKYVDPQHRPNRMAKQAHTRDTAKGLRRELIYGPPLKLEDPIKTLGHPARPRKKR